MKLNELKPNEGSRRNRKRVGRGTSSGYGKTAGRGWIDLPINYAKRNSKFTPSYYS